MKTHRVDTNSTQKYSAAKTFYNYRNNDFAKTNSFLNQHLHIKTLPDDLLIDEETYNKVIKNNQGISGSLNAKKFANKTDGPSSFRHGSTPVLLPLDLVKAKKHRLNTEISPDSLQSSGRNAHKRVLSVNTPQLLSLGYHPISGTLSPINHVNSARVETMPAMSETHVTPLPRNSHLTKSIADMTHEEIQALEKQIVAKNKLEQDKLKSKSIVTLRQEAKRDISYMSDKNSKPQTAQNNIRSTVGRVSTANLHHYNSSGTQETQVRPFQHSPEVLKIGLCIGSERSPQQNISSALKQNSNEFTSIEEEKPVPSEAEVNRRTHIAALDTKKASVDYSSNNTNFASPSSSPNKPYMSAGSGPIGSTLQDYPFKGSNLGGTERTSSSQHLRLHSPKPSTAGSERFTARFTESRAKRMLKFDVNEIKKMDVEELLNEARRELPNILTTAPVSRQDTIVLANWMETKIQQIADNPNMKEEEKSVQFDKVYNICLNEVFRQVTLECAERGDLLYKIWSCYFQLFSQFKTRLEGELNGLKAEYQKENQKQYEWYQELINKRDIEIEECKLEIQKMLGEQENNQKKIENLTSKNHKYKQKMNQLKGILSITKSQIEEIKDENRRYARRLAYKIANSTKGTYVPTFLAYNQGGTRDSRDASVPQNLGIGTSINSAAGILDIPLTPQGQRKRPDLKKINEKKELSSDSDESSLDFVYEDKTTQSKQVFKIDQLNNNVLAFKKRNTIENQNLGGELLKVMAIDTLTKETQTSLQLVETKYNDLFDTQKMIDELVTDLKVKREIDVLAEADILTSIDFSKAFENGDSREVTKGLKRTYSWLSMGTRALLEDRVDGLIKKDSPAKSKKKNFNIFTSDPNTPTASYFKEDYQKMTKMMEGEAQEAKPSHKRVPSNGQPKLMEEEKSGLGQVDKALASSPNPKNGNFLLPFEPIEEINEEGKSFIRGQSRHNTEIETKANIAAQTETDVQTEPQGQETKILPPAEEVIIKQEDALEQKRTPENTETPVPPVMEATNFATPHMSLIRDINNSSVSDDLFRGLDDIASETNGDKQGSREVGDDDLQTDSNNKPGERKYDQNTSMDEHMMNSNLRRPYFVSGSNMDSLDEGEDEPRKAFSLINLVHTKNHIRHIVSMIHARKEDNAILDKARLFTVIRMYKVEKEKNKILQNSVVELEEQIINEKQHQGKMQENIDELKVHIKMLEKLKAKCPHGKCAVCKGEEDGDFENSLSLRNNAESSMGLEDDGDKSVLIDGIDEVDEYMENNEDGEGLKYEEQDDEDNGGSGGDSGRSPTAGGSRGKVNRQGTISKFDKFYKKRKNTTAALQPEFAKKKVVNQNQIISAATAIIAKIKDKKLAKFRNFMPMKSVLKTIHNLYNDRANQAKENSSVKDEEFFVFAYKFFHNNFGFRKIAEQKYIIFLLSVKKYLHVVRINLFARFMSLLQGSSNFNTDEFNKYLEGIEFINNSTLGIPIVNSETDSKNFAPFLRGLEFLRYFSENKLATEEYIEFKREFEALKMIDPKNVNRNGIVDIDLFMTKVLTKYRIICNRTKQFVVNAFKAADLDGNKYCSKKEFIMIYRNIDPDRFDYGFAENLFNEHADIKVQGEINLSFDKFTVVCVEYGLFTDIQQDQFLGIQSPSEIEEKIQKLNSEWAIHYFDISKQLSEAAKTTEEDRGYWTSILKILNERITDFEKIDQNDYKPLLIAFKILEKEVERLRENEIQVDMYGVKIMKNDAK